jgi:hypothetical protein
VRAFPRRWNRSRFHLRGNRSSFERDRRHNVTLARFSGEFGPETIARLDHATELLVEAEGPSHFVLDFSGIERASMPDRAIAEAAGVCRSCTGYQRVIVPPQPEIFGLYRVFAAGQLATGSSPPIIVRSIGEALVRLGLRRPVFKPVDMRAIGAQARAQSKVCGGPERRPSSASAPRSSLSDSGSQSSR